MQFSKNNYRLEIIQGDITAQETDAVVNAANKALAPGGGVAGAIHRAAGPSLWQECSKLGGCQTGQAKITKGYDLPAEYVIHTVGPIYGQSQESAELLAQAYRNSLYLAEENNLRSIAFPALSTGAFGYPIEEAANIALTTIFETLYGLDSLYLVRLILHNSKDLKVHQEQGKSLANQYGWQIYD